MRSGGVQQPFRSKLLAAEKNQVVLLSGAFLRGGGNNGKIRRKPGLFRLREITPQQGEILVQLRQFHQTAADCPADAVPQAFLLVCAVHGHDRRSRPEGAVQAQEAAADHVLPCGVNHHGIYLFPQFRRYRRGFSGEVIHHIAPCFCFSSQPFGVPGGSAE